MFCVYEIINFNLAYYIPLCTGKLSDDVSESFCCLFPPFGAMRQLSPNIGVRQSWG